jgi:predicted ArsR family transcriptional regulator
MENMEKRLDKPSRVALMEDCGRACAGRGAVAGIAAPCRGDVAKLVERLGTHLGKENAVLDGRTARITYTKCYCPIVGAGPERLPDTWCECSRGWLLEMFETVAGKPVKVELLESIKRGGQACRFVVRL